MRVVHVITRLIIGGAQENTLYNVEDLLELYHDNVTLISGPPEGPEGNLFDRTEQKKLDIRILNELIRPVRPGTDWKAFRSLVRLFSEMKPDVVHTHSSKAGILGRAAAYHCQVPCIVHTIHGLPFHPYERWLKNRLYIHSERWAARRCHRIISVADAMTTQALAHGVGKPEQYVTIYSGMEIEPFLKPRLSSDQVRQQLGLRLEHLVVAKVARLFEHKGHDDVLEAAVPLARDYPNLRFVFIGGGIWEQRLRNKAQSLGLADRVLFTGLVPPARIPELLNASDIVVHASYREGLARVLPQAFLAGKPVVSYAVDGAPEVVLPEETGYLAKPGDIAQLSIGLRSLIASPEKRLAFGLRGRELCIERFPHQIMTRRIREVYEQVLHSR